MVRQWWCVRLTVLRLISGVLQRAAGSKLEMLSVDLMIHRQPVATERLILKERYRFHVYAFCCILWFLYLGPLVVYILSSALSISVLLSVCLELPCLTITLERMDQHLHSLNSHLIHVLTKEWTWQICVTFGFVFKVFGTLMNRCRHHSSSVVQSMCMMLSEMHSESILLHCMSTCHTEGVYCSVMEWAETCCCAICTVVINCIMYQLYRSTKWARKLTPYINLIIIWPTLYILNLKYRNV